VRRAHMSDQRHHVVASWCRMPLEAGCQPMRPSADCCMCLASVGTTFAAVVALAFALLNGQDLHALGWCTDCKSSREGTQQA
jgi:hypothetical protein